MRNFTKQTAIFMEPGKDSKPIQVGLHKTKAVVKEGGKMRLVPRLVPVFKGADAAFARYLRAQRKRLIAGKPCSVTPGYIK